MSFIRDEKIKRYSDGKHKRQTESFLNKHTMLIKWSGQDTSAFQALIKQNIKKHCKLKHTNYIETIYYTSVNPGHYNAPSPGVEASNILLTIQMLATIEDVIGVD